MIASPDSSPTTEQNLSPVASANLPRCLYSSRPIRRIEDSMATYTNIMLDFSYGQEGEKPAQDEVQLVEVQHSQHDAACTVHICNLASLLQLPSRMRQFECR